MGRPPRAGRWVAVISVFAVLGACTSRHPAGPPAPTTTGATTETELTADQATVNGTVTSAHLVDAVAPPLALPVTVTVPQRGHGGLRIETGAETIAWDGGQPLPLSGTGRVDLGPATVDVDRTGMRWHLDGRSRLLTPGRYVLGSTVAVGTSGLAQPEDRAAFTVAPGTQAAAVTSGDARIDTPAVAVSFTGPGNMTFTGNVTIHTATATRAGHEVAFGPGPFEVNLSPVSGGVAISALLQGPINVQ